MGIGSFVYRRGDTYSFRCRVPADLRSRVAKQEVVFALGTRDKDVARVLCAALGLRIKQLWVELERVSGFEEMDRIIREWFGATLQRAWADNFLDPYRDEIISERIAALKHDRPSANFDFTEEKARFAADCADHTLRQLEEGTLNVSSFRNVARLLAAKAVPPILENDRRVEVIAGQILAGESEVAETVLEWASGRTDFHPSWKPSLPHDLFPRTATTQKPDEPKRKPNGKDHLPVETSGLTISGALQRYIDERKPAVSTAASFQTSIRRFVEVFGDLDVARITKRQIAGFKDVLLTIPARLKPSERLLTVQEVAALYKDKPDIPRLSSATINSKHLAAVSIALKWASDNGYVDRVVSREVRAKGGAPKAKAARLPYSLEDLKAIFALPVFVKGERSIAGAGEAAVWLPILALYSGARLNELGTLRIGDVIRENGIDAIRIRTGKTVNAVRRIPIHDEVKRLGFLRCVEERRLSGDGLDGLLFPMIRAETSKGKKPTSPFSNWWGREARKAVPELNKSFHSFRHTAKRALRNARVDKTLRDAVMGHDAEDVAETYGLDETGSGFDLAALNDAIQAISYPGLTITLAPPGKMSMRGARKVHLDPAKPMRRAIFPKVR
ncbi:MAG: site-specific integrase [Gluconobacter potus]|uniref:Site-specific integrase n=1 Tax=Gluconobacter potus TaxID=2724927 RepID=A0ABR9YIH7_9PROT|nr:MULTISPECIES: site-specific integrase [Gluconobacter]MBF0863476.1 site-specific integrase [Gluconobacter sp. R71656]MBF0866283.1 site-specific integrase [Gluconobacter sp. R75628]MBF0872589.1 site-specific integrase [Gluconobacter sp. R75629]MBF0881555.1 site-specific integrase [Gluconobacter potus]